jgi:hypothetical protein
VQNRPDYRSNDPAFRRRGTPEKLIEKGFEQKNKFSWDKTARLLWTSVEKALQ